MNETACIDAVDEQDVARINRVAQGDRSAFEALYLDYHQRLSRFLMRFTERYAVIEEIINDTMYIVWTDSSKFRGASKVSTWIMGIAFRQASNTMRGLERAQRRDQLAAQDQQLLADDAGAEPYAQSQWLSQAMGELPLEQRATIELAYYLGYSCAEISEICACPVNTVKSRMHAARKTLRTLLPTLAGSALPFDDANDGVVNDQSTG